MPSGCMTLVLIGSNVVIKPLSEHIVGLERELRL